jgi:hypothetical protein
MCASESNPARTSELYTPTLHSAQTSPLAATDMMQSFGDWQPILLSQVHLHWG